MRQRNYKIILTVTIGFLLSFSAASAKNFNIFNAASPSQSYFTVNGTSGNVGIGITNPTTLLQILNNGWISAQNAAGTGVVNMFKVNASNQIEVGAPLNIGSFEFSPDSGLVSFVDMPVTSGAASGTPEGYAFKVDGDNIMTAYSESNGTGGIQNKRLGIGLTNPATALDVSGSLRNTLATTHSLLGGGGNVLVMADNTGALYATSTAGFGGGTNFWGGTKNGNIWNGDAGAGNVGIGTTAPAQKLTLGGGTDRLYFASSTSGTKIVMNNNGPTNYMNIGAYNDVTNSRIGFGYNTDPSSNTITEVMSVVDNSKVGIGTTAPGSNLTVRSSGHYAPSITHGAPAILSLIDNNDLEIAFTAHDLPYAAGAIQVRDVPEGADAAYPLALNPLGGNVGIGTTASPGTKLDVSGSFRNTLATTHSLLGGSGNVLVMADNTGALYATSTAGFLGGGGLWGGTLDGTIWNGTAGSGNVGIGTTTPSTKLQIVTSGTNGVVIGDTAYPSWMGAEGLYVDGSFRANSYLVQSGSAINWGASTAKIIGYSLTTSDTNSYLGFWTGESGNNYERMRIINNGNIGIGTTAPGAKLEVATNTSTLAQLRISGAYNTASSGSEIFLRESDPSDYGFKIGLESSNNRFYITSINGATVAERLSIQRDTGNIGIGTVTPLGKLDITGTQSDTLGEGAIRITNSVDAQRAFAIRLTADTVSDLTFDREYASAWSEALRIKRLDGNVGIGTTNPGTKLDVSGTLRNTLATTHSLLGGAGNVVVMADNTGALYATSTASLMSGGTNFWGGTLNGNIWNGDAGVGNVGIGTTNPGSKLTLKGDLAVEGTSTTSNAILNFTTPYYGRLNYSVTPNNGKSEVRFVSKGATAGAGQTYFVIASTEAADTGNNLLLGVASSRAFIANAVNYSAGGALHLGGASWSADGVVQISGLPTDLTGKMTVIGNVGMGTTSPTALLHLSSTSTATIKINSISALGDDSDIRFIKSNNGAETWTLGRDNTANDFRLSYVANVTGGLGTGDLVTFKSSGNVGVGTTNPTTKLYIAGTSLNTLATTHSLLGGGGDVLVMADNSGNLYATSTAGFIGGSGSYLPLTGGSLSGNLNMGGNNITNVNKLTVNTIDPLYNIQGINYSTFASSIAGGVKEEYLGRVKINKLTADGEREYIIDFDNLTKGSDLWVWRKTVDFSIDNVEVIATPYGNFAQVYYKIEDNKIIFRADRPTTISYRLSGRRIDWRNWPTKALDQEEKAGFVIE